jgi:hypothetical protein
LNTYLKSWNEHSSTPSPAKAILANLAARETETAFVLELMRELRLSFNTARAVLAALERASAINLAGNGVDLTATLTDIGRTLRKFL